MNLEGKVVVITGGGRGLGRAFASDRIFTGTGRSILMAFLDFSQPMAGPAPVASIAQGVSTPTDFTQQEWQIVALARTDGLRSLQGPGRFVRLRRCQHHLLRAQHPQYCARFQPDRCWTSSEAGLCASFSLPTAHPTCLRARARRARRNRRHAFRR